MPDDAPQAGDRFPWLHLRLQANGPVEDLFQQLDDTHYNLLVIGQPAPALKCSDLLRVHAVANDPHNTRELAAAQIAGPAYFLLRPDGHVGLAGARLELSAITRYLSECGLRTAATAD